VSCTTGTTFVGGLGLGLGLSICHSLWHRCKNTDTWYALYLLWLQVIVGMLIGLHQPQQGVVMDTVHGDPCKPTPTYRTKGI
jgi:hypothetical protein